MPLTRNALAQFAHQGKCWNSSVCMKCKIANVCHCTGVIVKRCDISSARGEWITEKAAEGFLQLTGKLIISDAQTCGGVWACQCFVPFFCAVRHRERLRETERGSEGWCDKSLQKIFWNHQLSTGLTAINWNQTSVLWQTYVAHFHSDEFGKINTARLHDFLWCNQLVKRFLTFFFLRKRGVFVR